MTLRPLLYIDSIENQIAKPEPDKQIVARLWASAEKIVAAAGLIEIGQSCRRGGAAASEDGIYQATSWRIRNSTRVIRHPIVERYLSF
jgi:hypothetical protein